jgi:hypothetical protein
MSDDEDHGDFDPQQLREHEEFTKVKNIDVIQLGMHEMDTWYFSPLPPEYKDCKVWGGGGAWEGCRGCWQWLCYANVLLVQCWGQGELQERCDAVTACIVVGSLLNDGRAKLNSGASWQSCAGAFAPEQLICWGPQHVHSCCVSAVQFTAVSQPHQAVSLYLWLIFTCLACRSALCPLPALSAEAVLL